jgi:seryl-tRNA synthetase
MEHVLQLEATLSGPAPAGDLLATRLPVLAEETIQRSIGTRGSGKLTEWSVAGDRLNLTIESDGPRPHQAALALLRRLGEELGKSAHIGVRSFRAPLYRVQFPLTPAPKKEIQLPIPHTLTVDGESATLALTDLSEEALRDNWMDRAVTLVQEKSKRQSYEGKEAYWALLNASPPKEHAFRLDPTEEMLKRLWVRSGPTKGKWFLGPMAAHLLRTMERIARQEVLEPLGFSEVVQPHHDSFDILLKTGHLEGLPGEFYYVTEPKTRDPAAWETFTDLVKITREARFAPVGRLLLRAVPDDLLVALRPHPRHR